MKKEKKIRKWLRFMGIEDMVEYKAIYRNVKLNRDAPPKFNPRTTELVNGIRSYIIDLNKPKMPPSCIEHGDDKASTDVQEIVDNS